jgi:lysophospholipase L1-like esterase
MKRKLPFLAAWAVGCLLLATTYKDIGKEFLDRNGGLSGDIMPDYLHLTTKGYDIWGMAIKGDLEMLLK